ncbi:MAG: sulfur carrier protein ThiS adenylyltransferase ThiF [Acidaminococcaceae bacterium]
MVAKNSVLNCVQPPSKEAYTAALQERLGAKVTATLAQAKVAIAGLGGLGSNLALMLARSGVGHLLLVDYDSVELTNLNRQAYRYTQLGQKKTVALATLIREINPYLAVTTRDIKVTSQNAADLFAGYPLVCEALDRPEQKALLVNTLLSSLPDVTIVAASGLATYASSNLLQTKKCFNSLYLCGDGVAAVTNTDSLLAPRVHICAGHQANMILRLLLGETTP